jgi:cell division protein FtsB
MGQEQTRIRENMARLAQNSELYSRYVKKLDQQETEIEKLRKEIETLKGGEDEQKRELNDFLLGLDIGG